MKARPALHASDSHLWALSRAEALRTERLDDLGLEDLADEQEGLALATRSAVRSRTCTIIGHLLKLQHSPPSTRAAAWRRTVGGQSHGEPAAADALPRDRPCDLDQILSERLRDAPKARAAAAGPGAS